MSNPAKREGERKLAYHCMFVPTVLYSEGGRVYPSAQEARAIHDVTLAAYVSVHKPAPTPPLAVPPLMRPLCITPYGGK